MPTWETASDWGSAVSENGVVHESVSNTDHDDNSSVKRGYSVANPLEDSTLLGFWPCHENSGSTTYDFGSQNVDGSISGASVNVSGPLESTVYSYDGSNDEVAFSESTAFEHGTGDFAWGFLIRKSTSVTSGSAAWNEAVIDHRGTSNDDGFIIYFNDANNGAISIGLRNGGSLTSSSAINDGSWHYVVFQRSGGDIEVWIDGSRENSQDESSTGVNGADLMFGDVRFDGRNADMEMGEVRCHSTDLSSFQIGTLSDVVNTSGTLTTDWRTP